MTDDHQRTATTWRSVAPRGEAGAWLDASVPERTEAGCSTCEWSVVGPYEEARKSWLEHRHDPVYDIRARLARVKQGGYRVADADYVADVEWLLAQDALGGSSGDQTT